MVSQQFYLRRFTCTVYSFNYNQPHSRYFSTTANVITPAQRIKYKEVIVIKWFLTLLTINVNQAVLQKKFTDFQKDKR